MIDERLVINSGGFTLRTSPKSLVTEAQGSHDKNYHPQY